VSTDTPVEETLAYEAEQRPRAVAAAIAGGVTTVAGSVLFLALTSDAPSEDDGFISLTEAVGARLDGSAPEGPSSSVRVVEFLGDRAVGLTISTVLTSIALACLAVLILHLWRAASARSELVGRLPYYATITSLILAPLGNLLAQISRWVEAAGFEGGTAQAAREVFETPVSVAGGLMWVLGSFALAVATVIVALNAMRVGLLTRFLGVLGIIVGVLPVLGAIGGFQLDQPGVIRAFWMVAVGLMIAGRVSTPPAWQTGRAEPWPTQQQLREQRDGAAGRTAAAPEPAPQAAAEQGDKPAELRKKRKRRR
jgi:hypothetical protein